MKDFAFLALGILLGSVITAKAADNRRLARELEIERARRND